MSAVQQPIISVFRVVRAMDILRVEGDKVSLSLLATQETLVFRYGSVVQTTSESSADRLKVDRTAESNRIHIFGNDSDQGRRIQILQIFNPFFDTTFLLKSLSKWC